MAQHHFAVSRTLLPARTVQRRDSIAREIAGRTAAFVQICEGGRWLSWASIPNRGEPFDRALAREIEAAWKAAGV